MDQVVAEFIAKLKRDIREWQEEIQFWEDPQVIGLKDLGGSTKTGKEIADSKRARIAEWEAMIARVEQR